MLSDYRIQVYVCERLISLEQSSFPRVSQRRMTLAEEREAENFVDKGEGLRKVLFCPGNAEVTRSA